MLDWFALHQKRLVALGLAMALPDTIWSANTFHFEQFLWNMVVWTVFAGLVMSFILFAGRPVVSTISAQQRSRPWIC